MLKRKITHYYAAVTGLTADWMTSRKIKVLMLIHIDWFDLLSGVCVKLCQMPGKLGILTQDLSRQTPITVNHFLKLWQHFEMVQSTLTAHNML